ncbi:hypothetical protein pipiens_008180 [Culex pipiens pipiens]|uniref:Myosin tail domain-containing protein n=1 Tax=Culex pipiens pipiens TaxID=38569 RepID=A0ABD1DIU4_CULPP
MLPATVIEQVFVLEEKPQKKLISTDHAFERNDDDDGAARSSTRAATAGPQKLYNKLISKINNFPHKSNKQGAKQQQQQSIVVPPLQSEQKKQQKLPVVNVVLPVHVVGSAGSGEHHHHDYENVLVVPSRVPESGVRGRRDGKSHHQKHEQQHNRHKRGGGGKGDAGNRMIPLTATAAKLFASESDKEDSCSLEDEIFEELEKVAHDEAKLCAALENFDKILSEYNDRGSKVKPPSQQQRTSSTAAKHEKTAKQHRQDHPKKILHKSKTCSIIESKCILKRASSDDESSLSSLPRAKSVWDLGSVTPPNSHTPASRTNSGSKIPISTSSSRSNSFILSSGSTMSLLSVSAAKLNDCRLKQQSENQCKTTTAGVSGGGLNGRNLRNVADSGGKSGKFRGLCSSAGAEKKPLHWKQSPSSISVLAIAPPPLKSPALVKQNKLCSSSAAAACGVSSGKNASKHAEEELAVVAVKLSARQEEFTPTIIPLSVTPGAITPPVVAASSPVVPAAPTVTTTTVIVVPPSPLPPPVDDCDLIQEQQQQRYDDEKNVADELLLLPCVDPYRKREDHEGEEEDEEEEDGDEEEYDGEEERVIDHLKCVVNQKNAVSAAGATSEKEETYQSDCSDDSGHISNENNEHEENLKPIPGKLTESLLEIFEQNCKKSGAENSGDSTPTIRANHLYELCNSNSDVGDNSAKVAISGEPKKLFNNKSDAKLTTTHVGGEVIAAATAASPVAEEDVVSDKNVATSCDQIVPPRCDTEVLFRSGVLNQLEAKRDELLSDRIIQLQSYCRGHLARKRLAQRRVQELAVKCIQRNVRAFMKVREWPWWRLLVRVTPLLNVHRTEEQLKIATTELQVLKSKLEKVEGERNSLKAENSKLESRLSEMTAEFAEEHSSSNLISERLEAETTERLRLEKEVKEHETKYRNLQESSEKLEMELLCAKSDLNGDLDDDLEGDEAGANAYRLKYERVARELEFTKKRLQTQHEHDLEQLIALKKQLEKKLADAYEEVEEQRQVVGQWKRKAQKMTNEMNDLRMLLEEQNSRNNLLEKRQRKFDSECQALQDSARQEKQAKERLTREKDVLIAEKFTIEQTLSDVRLELELKEEKYSALQRELEEMTFGGGTEEEIAQLKRQKMELDRRCKEQEEELDEMAGQIQLLEQAKLRLEMSLETMRKDARKEAQQRDDELEEVRGSSYKKIKSLECQLEQEHEERTLLLREKHDLERRLNNLEDQDRVERAAEEAASQKLKRDLRKYKALLRDAQSQLERAKSDSAGKALIRQLRNQLEDAESARSAAVKVRQVAESELQDVQLMLEEAQRARFDSEERATAAQRDRAELQAQIDENDEEMAELMKKYSATVKQLSSEQAMITDYELKISELESEKKSLKEQISDLTSRLESVENIGDSSTSIQFKRLELRTKELESRLEFEQATRARMEIQLNRHKDSLEKAQSEISQTRTKEMHAQEALKKAQKTIRELREELHLVANKEQESLTKRKDLEKRLECVEAEAASARADLRLALQRIADLQQAMEEGDSYHSDSENSDSSIDSVSEVNYHSPTKISSLRARSGETNGTGTNGSSTTLCIREEKENTPRIRYKYKPRGLRRRRLPFTIAEEDEAEDGVRPCEDLGTDDASQLDSVIESIKSAIGDEGEEDGVEDGETIKVPPAPKYTGAIKKTVIGKSSVSIRDELELSDANNNVIPKGQSKTLESTIVAEIAKASTVVADHLNDDSRFDLTALKSIKEKIKSLNNSLKEEAAQERCCKYEFPPPPPIVLSASQAKLESARIPDKATNDSFSKLDQISAELNLEGIRSMKEKIRNLKKRLQDESGSPEGPINKAQIASEIVEMKKTLTMTAAFINKSSEKLSLSRSSSQKEEKAPTLAPPTTNGHSKESSPALSSGSRSPVRNNSTPIVPRSLAVAQVSNGGPRGAAFEESRFTAAATTTGG